MLRSYGVAVLAALAFSAPGISQAEPASGGAAHEAYVVGYGLVAGLNYTGDSFKSCAFARRALKAMLERTNNLADDPAVFDGRIAVVIVTAHFSPASQIGAPMDLTVSAVCNARSLLGGSLLPTSLVGVDGQVYAMGQGALTPSIEAKDDPVGVIPAGAVVVRSLPVGR